MTNPYQSPNALPPKSESPESRTPLSGYFIGVLLGLVAAGMMVLNNGLEVGPVRGTAVGVGLIAIGVLGLVMIFYFTRKRSRLNKLPLREPDA